MSPKNAARERGGKTLPAPHANQQKKKVLTNYIYGMKRFLLLLSACYVSIGLAFAQAQTFSGVVLNESDGEPVIGASVQVKGTTSGTITDFDGKYSITAEPGQTLVISFIGMKTVELPVADGLKITLSENSQEIDEVMVVAFGTTTKKSFTGSASVVKTDDIVKRQTSNVSNALSGQVAGVQGISVDGAPGSVAKIRIRGIGSINASNAPLYVVDGVPADDNTIATLNNNDIESITVLKDAASNALYGARGANGVVLITTRRGNTKDAQITIDAKWGSNSREVPTYSVMTDPAMYYETFYQGLFNSQFLAGQSAAYAHEYANTYLLDPNNGGLGYQVYTVPTGQRLIGTNGKLNPNATLGYNDGVNYYTPDSWYNELFKSNNLRQEYNLNVSGSTDKINYFASASYLDDSGIIENSNYQRFTSRVNVDYQAKKWLKLGTSMSYAHADQKYPTDQTSDDAATSSGNLFYVSNFMAPIYPLYVRNADGSIAVDNNGFTVYDYGDGAALGAGTKRPFMSQSNPASAIALDVSKFTNDMFTGKWYAAIEFYKGLKATANIGVNYFGSRYQQTMNPFYGQYATSGGSVFVESDRYLTVNQQYLLTYNNRFAGLHNVDLLLGYENYNYTLSTNYGQKTKLFSSDIAEISNAILNPQTGSYTHHYATQGILAQAKYDYDSKYYISASYRRDASSRFAKKNRWGNFWSVGAAWDINAEPFMESAQDVVNLLKLKISYGAQGNDNLLTSDGAVNYYLYTDQYEVSENNGSFATALTYKGNEDITWETSYNLNGGVDFAFFDERLSGTIEGFWRRTVDMLYYKPVPSSLGYSSLPVNIGSVSNAGLDLELHGTPVKTRNVTWTIYANMTYFKNKILELSPELNGQWISGNYIYKEGESLYNFYIRKYAGVDPSTGKSLWYKDVTDAEGNVTGQTVTDVWADGTQYESGDILPKVYGGFGTTLDAYGVDFSIGFAYQLGGRVFDAGYQSLMHSGNSSYAGQNWHTDILDAWTPSNTDTNVPRVDAADLYTNATSDRWLISSNYLSLQNITLGYTLPSKWTRKAKIEKLRIYGVADNVALFAARKGLDPRQSYSTSSMNTYAAMRSISGGISITF